MNSEREQLADRYQQAVREYAKTGNVFPLLRAGHVELEMLHRHNVSHKELTALYDKAKADGEVDQMADIE